MWRPLLVLALLCSTASAQPILIPWRPPAGCSDGQAIVYDTTTRMWQCGSAGITNAAGSNVIPKSDGTNLVASQCSDNGTTITCTGTVNAQTGLQVNGSSVLAGSGTNGRSLRQSGGAITTGAFTDDGTNATAQGTFATLGNFTAGDSIGDSHTITGSVTQTDDGTMFNGTTTTSARSTSLTAAQWTSDGTFDASGAALSGTVGYFRALATRSTGSNALTNRALRATASGAQTNEAFRTDDGDVILNGSSGTTTIGGALTASSTASITGLLTATAGVTTPANLTTTGTGDLVSGDDLTVADAATIGGVLDVDNDLSKFGSTADGMAYIRGSNGGSLNFGYADNGVHTGYINYAGYQNGFTQFRNLTIADGKGGSAVTFTGSSKAAEFFGAADFDSTVNVDGNADFNAGVAVDGYFDALGDTITLGNAVTDEVYLQGAVVTHVTYTGTDPSLSSCGTGATITGSDERGIITTGTGATSCTLTFASTYVSTPACTFTLQYTGTPTGELFISSASASAVTVTSPDIDQSEGSPKIHYHCDGI